MTKPTRRQLVVTIARLQGLIGLALSHVDGDRNPDRAQSIRSPLEQAHELCIDTVTYENPVMPAELEAKSD